MKQTETREEMGWLYSIDVMHRIRSPAIVDKALGKNVTKGQAGMRRDRVVEKIWKDMR